MPIRHCINLAILLMLLLVEQVAAGPLVPAFERQIPVDSYATFLEDPSHQLGVEDIGSPDNLRDFSSRSDGIFNEGMSESTWWVKLTLDRAIQTAGETDRIFLEVPYAPLDKVDFYQRGKDGAWIRLRAGDHRPLSARPIRHYAPVFPVVVTPGAETEIFLKVRSTGSLRIPLTLWHQQAFYDHTQGQLMVFGVYFGLLALIFVFNLLFYLWLKDRSFLFYIAYVGMMAIFQGAYTGLGYLFAWDNHATFNAYAVVVALHLVNLFALMFANSVLRLRQRMPRAVKVVETLKWISLLLAPASIVLPYSLMLQAGTLMGVVCSLTVIILSVMSAVQGQRTAQLFLVAWLLFLASGIVLAGVAMGILPANPVTTNSLLIGSGLEAILLSIMLADRVHTTERDRTRSEQKAKIALQAVNRALLESNRVKDEFLATISHEMRTPMNGILQCLTHVRTEKSPVKFNEFIDNAEDSAQNLMNLIESVLSYTELQTHEFRIHNEPFRLQRMIGDLRENFSRLAPQKGLDFAIDIADNVPAVLVGDRRRLSQILTNLLDNAIKFTGHGKVRMAIEADAVDAYNQRAQLSFRVTDTGIGIPAGMEIAVFDRFRQLSASRSRQHGGLGIGLAVCKQIAQLMGADLRYQSRIGEGTEFTMALNLPFQPGDLSAPVPLDEGPDHVVTRLVLVVEDNPVNQLVLKTSLMKLGFNVLCASNGAEGVAAVEQNPVDLVLMDCQMPIMDGYDATRRIRELQAPKCLVPIVAITANAMSRDRDLCIEAGMNDYMSKPSNGRVLHEMMCKWVPGVREETRNG
jgi:signal transduction histidine kinase/ActR/RegA family two-component response regulator